MMKKVLIISLISIAIGLTSMSCTKKSKAIKDSSVASKLPVKVVPVKKQPYREYGEYFGLIRAVQESKLVAYAGGRVVSVSVKNGDTIKAGDKLCNIDGERLDVAYQSAVLAENISKSKYNRSKLHLRQGGTSKLAADQSKLEYMKSKSARVTAQKNMDGAFCISPISGTVVAKQIFNYQDISNGQHTITVAALDAVKILVGVPESAVRGYLPGNEVQVYLNSYPDRVWEGKIHSVAQSVNEQDRTVMLEIHVENKDHALLPGTTAKARILKWDLENEIVVPTESVITLSKRRIVMIARDDVAYLKTVKIRTSNETHSIVESGIEEGDLLIVSGHTRVTDGAPIKILGTK
jgi:membrane fusion protein, multidrug efflux system